MSMSIFHHFLSGVGLKLYEPRVHSTEKCNWYPFGSFANKQADENDSPTSFLFVRFAKRTYRSQPAKKLIRNTMWQLVERVPAIHYWIRQEGSTRLCLPCNSFKCIG